MGESTITQPPDYQSPTTRNPDPVLSSPCRERRSLLPLGLRLTAKRELRRLGRSSPSVVRRGWTPRWLRTTGFDAVSPAADGDSHWFELLPHPHRGATSAKGASISSVTASFSVILSATASSCAPTPGVSTDSTARLVSGSAGLLHRRLRCLGSFEAVGPPCSPQGFEHHGDSQGARAPGAATTVGASSTSFRWASSSERNLKRKSSSSASAGSRIAAPV